MSILAKNGLLPGLIALLLLAACNGPSGGTAADAARTAGSNPVLEVYKSPTCGCCGRWMTHVESGAFETVTRHPPDLSAIKDRFGIEPRYRSCHTAVSEGGYVFEGHIPVRYIRRFLADPPEGALGLAVPAMPVGSPGMEVGDKFMPYRVLLLKKDGGSEVYAVVSDPEQQYRGGPRQ